MKVLVNFKAFDAEGNVKTYSIPREVKRAEDAIPVEMGNIVAQAIHQLASSYRGGTDSLAVKDANGNQTLFYDFEVEVDEEG